MIFGATDDRSPNAPVWSGRPGWSVYVVTTDLATATRRAAEIAAEHDVPLAPDTFPLDEAADAQRITVGPVHVAVRTRQGHANGAPLATYYVLRRSHAEEHAREAASAHAPPAHAPATRWPFFAVGRHDSPVPPTSLGAGVTTWRGRLGRQTITFSTQPRKIAAHASRGPVPHQGIPCTTSHAEFIDVLVHHALGDAARADLAALVQAQDVRPVVVRCVGERLHDAADRHPPTATSSTPTPPEGRDDA